MFKALLGVLFLFAGVAYGGGKDFIPPNLITKGCAMTGTATCTSSVVSVQGFDNIALQANYSGTPTGTFFVDVSEDYNANTGNAGTWTTLPVTLTAPTGSAGVSYMDVNQTGAAYIRVRYTNSGGSGTLNVYLGGKMI